MDPAIELAAILLRFEVERLEKRAAAALAPTTADAESGDVDRPFDSTPERPAGQTLDPPARTEVDKISDDGSTNLMF